MWRNVTGQKIGAQLVSATDGNAFTGSVTVAVTIDAGAQATGSVGSGACTHEGGGYHTYAPAQAETNGRLIAFTFSGTGAVPVTVQVITQRNRTWYVAASGGSNSNTGADRSAALATIAEALSRANPGDTIRLLAGDHAQGSTMLELTKNNITIEGESKVDTIISGTVDGYGLGQSLVRIAADHITLRKLKISNAHADGYEIDSTSTTYGLTCEDIDASGGVDGGAFVSAHNSTFIRCKFSSTYDGLLFTTSSNILVDRCDISSSCSYDDSSAFRGFYAVNCTGVVRNSRIEVLRSTGSFTGKAHAVEQHTTTEQGWMAYENTHVIARVTNASGTTGAVRGFTTMDDGITFPWKSTIRGGSITTSNAGSGPNYNIDVNQTGSYVELQGVRMNGTLNGSSSNFRNLDVNVSDTLADTADMQPKLGTPAGASLAADIAAKPTAAEVATAVKATPLSISPASGTLEEAMVAARAQGFGRWSINTAAKTLTIYAPDDTTPVKVFNLTPSAAAPISRAPQ